MHVTLRPAVVQDAQALSDLDRQCRQEFWLAHTYSTDLSSHRHYGIVAEHRVTEPSYNGVTNELVGFIWLSWVLDVAQLENIVVAPHARGHHVATQLVEQCIPALRQRGVVAIELEVRSRNEAALALYVRMQFAEVGRRRKYYGDDDAVLMTRKI